MSINEPGLTFSSFLKDLSSDIILIIFSLMLYEIGIIYSIAAIISGAIVLFASIKLLLEPTQERAWTLFKISSPYLAILFIAMILDVIINSI